ncbi:ornithine cyclodeaminase family protein [Zhihengliuella halotolerans]|uniref:ornithine cyclodeaminase family protein n=1 Tax=Zhihengliuella halotolerans TaxID=370736 RepID=UPI001CA56DB7|nr:ornithine cyclodeaminase family protein [Zhihengliuella halotolerans]
MSPISTPVSKQVDSSIQPSEKGGLFYLREEETAALVDDELALDAARAAFSASVEAVGLDSLVVHGSEPQNRYTVKPAASATHAGVKIGTYWPGNDELGLPRHNSTLLLFDQRVGRISAVLEAGAANAYRTAAADALAVDLLARPEASTLAVFGTGHQAFFDVRAISKVRSIQQVLVVGRDHDKMARFTEALNTEGHNAVAADAESACRAADVIITVTTATVDVPPLFAAEWVRPGTHVSCMGADGPGKRELPPELLNTSRLFCDLPQQSRRVGEFQHAPVESELIMLGDVLTARAPGRTEEREITVFDSSGIGLQDLYLGLALLERKGTSL